MYIHIYLTSRVETSKFWFRLDPLSERSLNNGNDNNNTNINNNADSNNNIIMRIIHRTYIYIYMSINIQF